MARLRPRNGASKDVYGLYASSTRPADVGDRSVARRSATLTLAARDAEGVAARDQVDVGDVAHDVRSVASAGPITTLELAVVR